MHQPTILSLLVKIALELANLMRKLVGHVLKIHLLVLHCQAQYTSCQVVSIQFIYFANATISKIFADMATKCTDNNNCDIYNSFKAYNKVNNF